VCLPAGLAGLLVCLAVGESARPSICRWVRTGTHPRSPLPDGVPRNGSCSSLHIGPLPHLLRDRERRRNIGTTSYAPLIDVSNWTALLPPTSAPRLTAHVCTGTAHLPPTSAPGPRASSCHVCTGTGLTPPDLYLRCAHSCRPTAHVCTGTGAYRLPQYRRIAAAADGHSRGTYGVLRRDPSDSASACIGEVCALTIRSAVTYEALALASAITLQHEAAAARTAVTVSASGAVPAAYWHTGRRIAALPARSHLEGSQCGGTRVTSSRRPRFCQWPLRARPRRTANHGPAAKGRADSDGQAAG